MFIDKGMTCLQSYGTADLGTIAYESESIQGMTVDEGVIVEIVRPGTGDPVPEGDVGEVVVTTFNRAYPLIRFGTGDMSAVLAGPARAGAPTCASRAGWAAPTSAPRCAACSSIPSRSPRSPRSIPGWAACAWSSTGSTRPTS